MKKRHEAKDNSGRASLVHKLHAKGLPKKAVLAKVKAKGLRISPSLLNRIWKRLPDDLAPKAKKVAQVEAPKLATAAN